MKLKTISDKRGHLTVIERLAFPIRRVYYLHGIDINATRGGHAHRKLERLMVAVSGSFKVNMDGQVFELSSPEIGLYIAPLAWIEVTEFTKGAVCLVLASKEHDEADCIRDFDECKRLCAERAA